MLLSTWRALALTSGFLLASRMSTLSAQQPLKRIQGPASSVLFTAAISAPVASIVPDTAERVPRPTQWKGGLLIGGLIGAVGFGGLVYGLCEGLKETQGSCVGSGLGGAALGAVIGGTAGALIGGQFSQDSATVPADSTARAP
jgi:quinol-cytochrome oxidoreductase complex cytochrome b subunit